MKKIERLLQRLSELKAEKESIETILHSKGIGIHEESGQLKVNLWGTDWLYRDVIARMKELIALDEEEA